jgi:hypothetical protein
MTLYPTTGTILREEAQSEASCGGDKPAEEAACMVIEEGEACDDGDDSTMGDVCSATETCAGKVQLASAATLDIDIEALSEDAIPNTAGMSVEAAVAAIDASPVAVAFKPPLAAGLAVDPSAVTITSIGAGSIEVEFVVAVPVHDAAATQTAATSATSPTVRIPASASASGVPVDATAAVAALKSYAYVKQPRESVCSAEECSNTCGSPLETALDVYACKEDGITVALALCASALGQVPVTETVCCLAADPVTCEETGRAATSCAVDQYVSSNACEGCAAGTTNALVTFAVSATVEILVGDSKLGDDTACDATLCAVDEYVSSHVCTACAAGEYADAGADASGADTACAVEPEATIAMAAKVSGAAEAKVVIAVAFVAAAAILLV